MGSALDEALRGVRIPPGDDTDERNDCDGQGDVQCDRRDEQVAPRDEAVLARNRTRHLRRPTDRPVRK